MSVAQVWTGPAIEEEQLKNWRSDAEVAAEVPKLASRRVPIADAEAEVTRFAEELDEAGKADRLTLLFAGIFNTLGAERGDVIEGIERYGRRQKAMAEEIRVDQARLSDLRTASPNAPATAALNEDLLSRIRVFNERRTSLTFVCEVPTLIEERMFALGRAIAKTIPN